MRKYIFQSSIARYYLYIATDEISYRKYKNSAQFGTYKLITYHFNYIHNCNWYNSTCRNSNCNTIYTIFHKFQFYKYGSKHF